MVLDPSIYQKSNNNRTTEEQDNFQESIKIFDHHKNIGIVHQISGEKFQELYEQETRSLILKILGKGILDTHPKTLEETNRYALSGAEIVEEANKLINDTNNPKFKHIDKVTKSNVFFHLRKLEETGFVKDAGVIKSGRRRTTYYGKTYKVFITMDFGDHKKFSLVNDQNFSEFLKTINPNTDEKYIDNVLENLSILNQETSDYFIKWLKKYEEELKPYMFDFGNLLMIFKQIQQFKTSTVESLQELSDLLHVNHPDLKDGAS